jgi:hypothetical protein
MASQRVIPQKRRVFLFVGFPLRINIDGRQTEFILIAQ